VGAFVEDRFQQPIEVANHRVDPKATTKAQVVKQTVEPMPPSESFGIGLSQQDITCAAQIGGDFDCRNARPRERQPTIGEFDQDAARAGANHRKGITKNKCKQKRQQHPKQGWQKLGELPNLDIVGPPIDKSNYFVEKPKARKEGIIDPVDSPKEP
jgi:hypothetical protein